MYGLNYVHVLQHNTAKLGQQNKHADMKNKWLTLVPTKSDSDVVFCLQYC